MRFVADANVERPLVDRLRQEGHDVLSIAEIAPRKEDPDVLRLAVAEDRILLTSDKDFGMLTFFQLQAPTGIILMRLPELRSAAKAERLLAVLSEPHDLRSHLTIIQPNTVRRRPFPSRD